MNAITAPVKAKAVVCRDITQGVHVEEVTVALPQRGEVMIKLAACGVCHSDLSATNGVIGMPLPVVVGHEGAGVVVAVGEGVTEFALGDHVVSSFVSMCGKCRYCQSGRPQLCDQAGKTVATLPGGGTRYTDAQGQPLSVFFGCGVMAEYTTLHESSLVKIDSTVALDKAALVSCGVMTGVGAVVNTAKLTAGSIAVVFGCGGVGLNAIQGCVIAGARQIVAVDMSDAKLELAKQFGATHVVNSAVEENIVKTLRKMTGGGADYAFECVGRGDVSALAFGSLGKGGTAVSVGVSARKDTTTIGTLAMTCDEKTLKGSYFGSARPREDFPRLIGLYCCGKLKLDELITRTHSIDEAPQAFEDLKAGRNARGMIVFA